MKILSGLLTFMFSLPVIASDIEWDLENAIVQGSGCQAIKTRLAIRNGNLIFAPQDLSIRFKKVADQRKIARQSCSLSIPITLKEGTYISRLASSIKYRYVRQNSTSGNIVLKSGIFEAPELEIRSGIPTQGNSRFRGVVSLSEEADFLPPKDCGSSEVQFFRVTYVISASRENTGKTLQIKADPAHIKVGTSLCEQESL